MQNSDTFLSFFSELDMSEVAHDTVVLLKKDLEARGVTNAYDTWHGGYMLKSLVYPNNLKDVGVT